ncbi:restriction endonuclease subunit S [Sporosarcina sp. FA9]|uniref:restriction endonuclease subunit S n=1 Tax=Sporosarcina sp. FA9 TaxID=3413030 RepID=UPI003F6557B3
MEFEEVFLKEIAVIKNGKKPKTKRETGKYPIFGSNGVIGYTDESYIQKDSIVIGRVGANCGSVIFSAGDFWVSDNAISIVPKESTDVCYLYYLLITKRINEYSSGSAQPLINQSILNSIPLMLPRYEIQKRIGKFLKNIDDKIFLNNQVISNLEQLAQTVFKRWFVDFEFPNENGEPHKSSGGEMVESEFGLIPKGWRVATLGEVCDANKESKSSKDKWKYVNYLDTGSITRNQIGEIRKLYTGKDKIPSRAKRIVKENDIVYSTVRPNQHHYGIIKEPKENMLVSTGFVVLTSKTSYSNDLVYIWLTQNEITQKLQSLAEQSTSTYPSIKPIDILSIKLLIPLERELIQLSSIVAKKSDLSWKTQQQNQALIQLRDTLLPKLLSGEIELPDETEVTERVPIT